MLSSHGGVQLAVTFPGAVVAADSWWRYDAGLDVEGEEYTARLAAVNAKMIAKGVDGCPTDCMLAGDLSTGCNETARCGVPYISVSHATTAATVHGS